MSLQRMGRWLRVKALWAMRHGAEVAEGGDVDDAAPRKPRPKGRRVASYRKASWAFVIANPEADVERQRLGGPRNAFL